MIDKLKGLIISALFVAIIGGIAAFLLGSMLGAITAVTGFATIVGGIAAVVLLLIVATYRDVDKFNIFELVMLLVVVGVVGTSIVTVLPAASDWILTASGTLSWNNIAWSRVYVGLAIMGKEKVM